MAFPMKIFPVLDGKFEDYFNLTGSNEEIEGYIYRISHVNETNFLCTVVIHNLPDWRALFMYQVTKLPNRNNLEYPELVTKMNSFNKEIVKITRETDEDFWEEVILNYLTAWPLNDMIDAMDEMCLMAYKYVK